MNCCVAQFLIDRSANTHTRDARLDSTLHRVAVGGCADCLRTLLDRGEDVECMGAKDRSPLHVAAANGHATLVSI
jgi:serine/threonine-protein phosphatase 6 regulatory ankyrin repeat subunit C